MILGFSDKFSGHHCWLVSEYRLFYMATQTSEYWSWWKLYWEVFIGLPKNLKSRKTLVVMSEKTWNFQVAFYVEFKCIDFLHQGLTVCQCFNVDYGKRIVWESNPSDIYLFKVNNGNTRRVSEICLNLATSLTWVWCSYCRLWTFFCSFEQICRLGKVSVFFPQ